MRKTILVILTLSFSVILASLIKADQPLPVSPWYAIVHQPETDTLHWINAAGEQASMPRPTLENETQFLDLRVSPNGQTMFMASEVIGGQQGLGIYDFASGLFIQTHLAQPGETINLGGENIFTPNSQYGAVGLFSGDFATPAWRVILFEMATGDAVSFIDNTHPDAPAVQLSAPAVQYIDSRVHFQLIPQAVGGSATWPAYAWQAFAFDPQLPVIDDSPFVQANAQIQLLTGTVASTYVDNAYAVPPVAGQYPTFNAVGWSVPNNDPTSTTVHADATRYHLQTRWAKGGEWILFYSVDALGDGYWNNLLANGTPGNNSHMPFPPQFEKAYGTSDGYLVIDDSNQLFYTNGFMPNTALNIAQLTDLSEVVYVTPIGVNFTLDNLGDSNGIQGPDEIAPNPTAANTPIPVPGDCSLAPPQRMILGGGGRVITGALNMRTQPNGAIILTLNNGQTFDVVGGPICDGGLYWWQINRFGSIGWAAEGNAEAYFMEPYEGPEPTIAPTLEPTSTPGVVPTFEPPGGLVPVPTLLPTLEPPGGFAPLPTPVPTIGGIIVPGIIVTIEPIPTIGGIIIPGG
jgi:hypothetical protein